MTRARARCRPFLIRIAVSLFRCSISSLISEFEPDRDLWAAELEIRYRPIVVEVIGEVTIGKNRVAPGKAVADACQRLPSEPRRAGTSVHVIAEVPVAAEVGVATHADHAIQKILLRLNATLGRQAS